MSGVLHGGCQCGRVRYAIGVKPVAGVHLCHCRMCQKAVGNVFAALAPMPREHLTWLGEPPDIFESSSIAERGFCSRCGTPLTFEYKGSGRINVTIGSLDDPNAVAPVIQYGVESRVAWLKLCDGLPEETYDPASERLHGMKSYQRPDRA